MKTLYLTFMSALLLALTAEVSRADDRISALRYVTEQPDLDRGELKRTTSYNATGVRVGVKVEYSNGRVRNESYRQDGTLSAIHVTDFKGWSRDTKYGDDGKIPVVEVIRREDRLQAKTEYLPKGALRITRYGFDVDPKIDYVDEVDAQGNVERSHYSFDQQKTSVSKLKREELGAGSVKWTKLDETTGKPKSIEIIHADDSVKRIHLGADGVTVKKTATYESIFDKYASPVAEEFYSSAGILKSDRKRIPETRLEIRAFQTDGQTPLYKQVWRYEKRVANKKPYRATDWLLEVIEEYNHDGTLARKLFFDRQGVNVAEVHDITSGVVTTRTKLNDDATNRVNATVSTIETTVGTSSTKTFIMPSGTRQIVPIDEKRLLDPHYGEKEPGIVRIIQSHQ